MNSVETCCSKLSEILSSDGSILRRDKEIFFLSTQVNDGFHLEVSIEFCPFCGVRIGAKDTHLLEQILNQPIEFIIHFDDGQYYFTGCDTIDFSIYQKRGGWCCFNKKGGVDVYEKDILKVLNAATGELIYERKA